MIIYELEGKDSISSAATTPTRGGYSPTAETGPADLTGLVSCPLAEAKNKTDTSPDGDRFAVCLALQRGSGFRVICPLVAL